MDDDLRASYAGIFDGALAFGDRPALLLVDVVRAYTEPASPLYAAAGPRLDEIAALTRACRAAALPIFFTNVLFAPGGADGGLFYRKVPALKLFEGGSALARFPDGLGPQPDEPVITKKYASAFAGTSLASLLTCRGVDTLLIAGYSTSGCVRASALDALQHGFAPFVVSDCCADKADAPHRTNLFDLQAKYAEVIDLARALRYIAG